MSICCSVTLEDYSLNILFTLDILWHASGFSTMLWISRSPNSYNFSLKKRLKKEYIYFFYQNKVYEPKAIRLLLCSSPFLMFSLLPTEINFTCVTYTEDERNT